MRYRNVKTGIEFTSSCAITGADIVEIKPAKAEVKAEPKVEAKAEPKAEPKKAESKPKTTKRSKK